MAIANWRVLSRLLELCLGIRLAREILSRLKLPSLESQDIMIGLFPVEK